MDVKHEQDIFDLHQECVKTEPEIDYNETKQNKFCANKPQTFKNEYGDVIADKFNAFESETTEQFTDLEIKEEIIECEMPKIETQSDLPIKNDQETILEKVQIFPKTIKEESEKSSSVKVIDIKEEVSEYIQAKTESEVNELLTSHCNLPTLKIENADYNPDPKNSGLTNISKPLKNTVQVILKKKKNVYPSLPEDTAKPPKTKAEYQKAYREREKAKKNKNKQESTAKPPKTKAEYQKEYRERQKAKKNENKQERETKETKRNREYQRAWRQRNKNLKKKDSKEEKEEKKRKRHRANQRAYYQRIKDLKKNDKNVEELFQKKLDDLQMKRKKLDSNEDQQNVVQCRASQNLENVQLEQNQFLTKQLRNYEESHECITPKVILHRNKDIPGDANCLFHSLICVLQLEILTCDLRRQLRDSPYLNSCHNPQEAYNILSSNNEYGDLDCLYLFGKMYNQNICVHYHYLKAVSKNEDTRFCHFKANDTHNWIHLDLRELYFTPYFSDDEKIKEDERKRKQKNKEYSKRYRDKKETSNLQTGPSTKMC